MENTKIKNAKLKKRIISLSYKHHLSHLGSCITAVDIIDDIFSLKKPDEKFILSAGHAGVALYAVLEKYRGIDAERNFLSCGVHPDRLEGQGIDCSTGSLGHGIGIALGVALADRSKNVYCLLSDGECAEGSVWEALRIRQDLELYNLHVYVNANGYGAYKQVNSTDLGMKLREFGLELTNFRMIETFFEQNDFPFLKGQIGHYKVLTDEEYKQALEILK